MGQGPHVRGNVRYALQVMLRMHPLQGIIFSFPCKNICDADNTPGVREAKVKDGRYIFGMLQVIWMFCIATRLVRRIAGELADIEDAAGTADISSIQSNSIPQADMLDAAGSMQRCRAALDAAARRAHSHPPEEDEPTDVDEDSDGDGIIQGGATTTVVAALTSGPAPAPPTSRLVSGPNPHRARRSLG